MVDALWVDDGNGPIQNPAISPEDFPALLAAWQANNVASLWQSAYSYEFNRISGTAVALLAQGVVKGGPVAKAILEWSNSLWALYYERKPLVLAWASPAGTDWTLMDFSSLGELPHSIPELLAEVSS